jgi:hypothetical protein
MWGAAPGTGGMASATLDRSFSRTASRMAGSGSRVAVRRNGFITRSALKIWRFQPNAVMLDANPVTHPKEQNGRLCRRCTCRPHLAFFLKTSV